MNKVWSIATVAACAFVYGAVLGGTLALGNEGQSTPSEGQKTDAREDARLPERVDLIKYVDEALKEPLPAKTMTNDDAELAWGRSYWMMAWLEMLEATGDPRYAERLIKLAEITTAVTDDKRKVVDAYRKRITPAWSCTQYTGGKRYVFAVHTGMIVFPIARFAAIVRSRPALKERYDAKAAELLRAAERAVALHDVDFRNGPGADEGYLYCYFVKRHLPLNQQNALVRAWLAIDEANGTTRYTDRARKLGNFFKHRLRHDKKEDLYDWAYWPELEGPGRGSEDTPHAYINVKTAALLHDQGLVFDKADMRRFCNTFTERVLPPSLRVAGYINGEGKPGESPHLAVAYGRLAFYDTKVRDRLHEYVGKILMPKKVRGGWACLGVAYLIHALPDEKPTKAPP